MGDPAGTGGAGAGERRRPATGSAADADRSAADGPGRPGDGWLLTALFVVALLVRIPGMAGDLWLDEIGSLVSFVRLPFDELVVTYLSANNHVLYSALSHGTIAAFGETSWAMRLPAVLFGAAAVPVLFVLARRWLARREALAAAAILAFSYHHAYFSQNARGYTGLVCLALLSTWLLARALDEGRRRDWSLYAVITATTIYLLLSGLFVCFGQVLGVLLLRIAPAPAGERGPLFRRLATWIGVAALITIALYAPLMASMLEFFSTADRNVGWTPSWELVRIILRDALVHPAVMVVAVLAVPVALVGLLSLVSRAPLVAFGLAVPVVIELAVAMGMGVGTYPRRFLLLLPFLILVAVRGSAWLSEVVARAGRRPALAGPLFTGIVVAGMLAGAAGLPRLWTTPKQDYSGALAWVEEQRDPGDHVASLYTAALGVELYGGPHVGNGRELEDLEAVLADGRRVWLVGTFEGDMRERAPEMTAIVDQGFDRVAEFGGLVGDGTVVVWRQRED